jgi:hypothetical protein
MPTRAIFVTGTTDTSDGASFRTCSPAAVRAVENPILGMKIVEVPEIRRGRV